MNRKISFLLFVGLLCYANSADTMDKTIAKEVSNKEKPNLLKSDTANVAVAPTKSPTSVSKPDDRGDWVLNYTPSAVCIRLAGEIKIKVNYTRGKNETGQSEITIPKTAIASGNCSTGAFSLSWPSNGTGPKKNETIQFAFIVDTITDIWRLINITGSVILPIPSKTAKLHQDIPFTFYDNSTPFFNANVGKSYKCMKSNSYELSYDQTNHKDLNFTSAVVLLSDIQAEPFKPDIVDNWAFGNANACELAPDMVPIAVGCALAGLVVIVLVAYLISQRTPPAKGYRSV